MKESIELILQKVASGALSPAEGARLIDAIQHSTSSSASSASSSASSASSASAQQPNSESKLEEQIESFFDKIVGDPKKWQEFGDSLASTLQQGMSEALERVQEELESIRKSSQERTPGDRSAGQTGQNGHSSAGPAPDKKDGNQTST